MDSYQYKIHSQRSCRSRLRSLLLCLCDDSLHCWFLNTDRGQGTLGLLQGQTGQHQSQTPGTGLRHPISNHCRNWLRHAGLEKLSANGQFFVRAQNGCKFVTDNSDCIRHFFHNRPCCWAWLESRRNFFSFFFCLYTGRPRVIFICCFNSRVSPQPFRRVLTASVDCCTEIKSVLPVV